jgi:hypothetical protein
MSFVEQVADCPIGAFGERRDPLPSVVRVWERRGQLGFDLICCWINVFAVQTDVKKLVKADTDLCVIEGALNRSLKVVIMVILL